MQETLTPQIIGARIKRYRTIAGLSLQNVADLCGYSSTKSIRVFESGESEPRGQVREKLLAALKSSEYEIFEKPPNASEVLAPFNIIMGQEPIELALADILLCAKSLKIIRGGAPCDMLHYNEVVIRRLREREIKIEAIERIPGTLDENNMRFAELLTNSAQFESKSYDVRIFADKPGALLDGLNINAHIFDETAAFFLIPNHSKAIVIRGEPISHFVASYWSALWHKGSDLREGRGLTSPQDRLDAATPSSAKSTRLRIVD